MITWKKREKEFGSKVSEWIGYIDGVFSFYIRKFGDDRFTYSSYQVFVGDECVAQFWPDRKNWVREQSEMLSNRSRNNLRGGISEAKKFCAGR